MKLASFKNDHQETRVGVVLAHSAGDLLVDVQRVYACYLAEVENDRQPADIAAARTPTDMRRLLQGGAASLAAVRNALSHVGSLLGDTHDPAKWRAAGIAYPVDAVRFLPPIPHPGKIVSCGANYRAHVAETAAFGGGAPAPAKEKEVQRPKTGAPPAFAKLPSTMVGHRDSIVHSRHTTQLDYEGELCAVIGKRCKDVPVEQALDVIAGYTIMNDVSMRDIQFRRVDRTRGTGQFDNMLGKNLDTTAPCGPYLVTSDEVGDPQALELSTYVNGERRQFENTANMIYPVAMIVAHYSRLTLEPGDIFTTGNPAGSAMGRTSPDAYWLRPGDIVEVEIERIGRLTNPVVAET